MNKPRQYALVKLEKNYESFLKERHPDATLLKHKLFIYLGEVPNMPGHCVVAEFESGHIMGAFHIEDFEELSEEET